MSEWARISDLQAQVVLSANGIAHFVTQLVPQIITQGSPERIQVSALNTQVVTSSTPKRIQVAQLLAQVIQQNQLDGGYVYNAATSGQVVYTIGVPDTPRQKAWTFDFDGHTFYVLDLAESGALVYDVTTQSWSRWNTEGYEGHFNFKNGFHWRGGKQVVGGGLLDGLLVTLDPDQLLDEEFRPVTYEVQGVIFATTERHLRQYNLRMVGSPGRTALTDIVENPILNMSYSDDNGKTWSNPRAIELKQDDYDQRIQFRSLGSFRQPGRIFRLYDNGGIKFIAYVMADVEGEQT